MYKKQNQILNGSSHLLFTQTQKTDDIIIIIVITIVILILAIQKLIGRREKLTTLIKVLDHPQPGSFLRSPSL